MNNKCSSIIAFLDETFPHAHCELNYSKDYELALAVILSAQTTDKAVNNVTKFLFDKYKTISELANADVDYVADIIHSLGMYRIKAKNIVLFAQQLLFKFNGVLPSNVEDLTSLTGVGNKSASVIRIEVFKIDDFPVDTHIKRISHFLGLSKSNSPDKISVDLKKLFPKEKWIKLHHQLIFFGRTICKAKNPGCENCKLHEFCTKFKKNN